MTIKGVLFDMDGVLFDTERLHIDIDQQLAAQMGYTLPEELVTQLYGSTDGRVRQLMLDAFGPDFNCDYFQANSWKMLDKYLEKNGLPIKPGVVELLTYLSEQGISCAISSSSPQAVILRNLEWANIGRFFSVVVSGDVVEVSKPDPEIFISTAKQLGIRPAFCLAIEDSFAGVRSAARAGCVTAMVPDMLHPTPEIRSLCDVVLDSLHEVIDYIEQINRI